MRIIIAALVMLFAPFFGDVCVLANTITLSIAENGSTTATLDIPSLPNGPDYVLAVLPFELSSRAVITSETDPKDIAYAVSYEPRGVLAITSYNGKARFKMRNAIDAIDGDRLKIRFAKQDAPYDELKTLGNPPGILVDTAQKAIIAWTTYVDLPENIEDLKPPILQPVRNRLTLDKTTINNELILDMKNPALALGVVSSQLGSAITLMTALLIGLVASWGAWEKASPSLHLSFVGFVIIATGFAIYRAFIYGWSEAVSTLGGIAGVITIAFNLGLIGFTAVRSRSIATVEGKVTEQGRPGPVEGVRMLLEKTGTKTAVQAISDRDGNYQISVWRRGSAKQDYTLKAVTGFAENWQKGIELGRGDTETADVELVFYGVIGRWELDQKQTETENSERLIRSVDGALDSREAQKIAVKLQAELSYPEKISVQKDNAIRTDQHRWGRWYAGQDGPGAFDVSIEGAPELELMKRRGDQLILHRRRMGLLAAVYSLDARFPDPEVTSPAVSLARPSSKKRTDKSSS